ncbi:MAG: hypothetical protein GY851_25720 [bacterium]|nr:hypothetical protein [bacterium]
MESNEPVKPMTFGELCADFLAFVGRSWRRFKGFCKRCMASPAFIVAILAMVTWLSMGYVSGGFAMDDHLYRASFKGFPGIPEYARAPLMGHLICSGQADQNMALIDRGVFPWWGTQDGKLAFWRPLSTLFYWIDFTLWENEAVPMHLHNIAWYLLVCVLAAVYYRRLMQPCWIAGLAALLFAFDDAHCFPVAWLAHRYSLMAAAFCLGVLITHDRWRKGGSWLNLVAGIVLLLFGLASGEAAMAVGAYLTAYALVLEEGPWRPRLLSLAPYAAVGVAYLAVYRVLGFGTHGTGWYTDPFGEPLAFLTAVVVRVPAFLVALLLEWPGDLLRLLGSTGPLGAVICSGILALMGLVLVPMLRHDRMARFWLAATVLSLPLICTVMPQPRLLLWAGIGAMGFVARFFGARGEREAWLPKNLPWRIGARTLAVLFVLAHLVVAPFLYMQLGRAIGANGRKIEASFATLPDGPAVKDKTLMVYRMPNDFTPWYFAIMRSSISEIFPEYVRVLSTGYNEMTITRPDDRTLILRPEKSFMSTPGRSMYRSSRSPMAVGDTVELSGMTVQVTEVDDTGWPTEAEFQFDRPLEDADVLWYSAVRVPKLLKYVKRTIKVSRFCETPPPEIGETISLDELVKRSGNVPEKAE